MGIQVIKSRFNTGAQEKQPGSVDGQQKPTQCWKAIIHQLKISKFLQEAWVIEKHVQVSLPVASGAMELGEATQGVTARGPETGQGNTAGG